MSSGMLCGEKVYLRPVSDEDLVKMSEWGNDPELKHLMGPLAEEIREPDWYKRMKDERNSRVLAIYAKDGGLIGDIGLTNITWRNGQAELIVRIGEKEYWGQGYGADAVILLLHYAFLKLNLKRIYLRVHSYNRRAIRCYEKCGFKKEGILRIRRAPGRKGYTIILMNVLRDEFLVTSPFRLEA